MHKDVEVTLWEEDDTWRFTLRGRDRAAPSPSKARDLIDRPVPANKAKPFTPIPAILSRARESRFIPGTITSIAADSFRSDIKVWFSGPNGRQKFGLNEFVAPTPENLAIIAECEKLMEAARSAEERARELGKNLAKLTIEVPE